MACKYSESFPTPQDFPTIYHDFLQRVMRDKPSDPIDYGAFYFEAKSLVKNLSDFDVFINSI